MICSQKLIDQKLVIINVSCYDWLYLKNIMIYLNYLFKKQSKKKKNILVLMLFSANYFSPWFISYQETASKAIFLCNSTNM